MSTSARFDSFALPGDGCQRLRERFVACGFTEEGVAEAIGIEKLRAVTGQDSPLLARRTRGGSDRETFIRLFLIGLPVEATAAARAAAGCDLAAWREAGLVDLEGETVTARVQILPFEGLWLTSDQPRRIEAGLAPDFVMGLGSSSLTLANLTIRRPSRRTLDLGTGCGFQGLLAARHSEQVAAVDRNPRAVRLAAFNARLNGQANVECLEGDLFAPVAGRRFDLVVTNPPFVISPESKYIYRDSGMKGDAISQTIARRVAEFLEEGGYCQILCNWAHLRGDDWRARLSGWFAGTGCDAWVLRSDTLEAAAYAAKWIRHTERDSADNFARRFDEWADYYEREAIEAVSGGLVTLRRRSGTNWFRADDAPEKMLGAAGDAIARGFEHRDFLAAHEDDRALLACRLRLTPDARLEQRHEPRDGAWRLVEAELRLVRGLGYAGNVDLLATHLTARCDGSRPLGAIVVEIAAAAEEDPNVLAPACLEIARRLVEHGFLLPAESEPPNAVG